MIKQLSFYNIAIIIFFLFGTACSPKTNSESIAPGAPGEKSVWAYAGKTGIGTSYETYTEGNYSDGGTSGKISKVWFSIAQGIVTETMYGLIHEAQLKEMQFVIVGDGFVDQEKFDTESTIEYLNTDEAGRPVSLAYKIITRDKDGKYEIEKHIFTNPEENALFVRATFRSNEKGIVPYLLVNPHMNNTGNGDKAWVERKGNTLHASDNGKFMTIQTSQKFQKTSVGFVGVSDGLTDLKANGKLSKTYTTTGDSTGNVAITAMLKPMNSKGVTYDFVVGFGDTNDASAQAASKTLELGYNSVLANYNGDGENVGWSDYLISLPELEKLSATATDGGKLLYASAMVLKAQEDKSNAGALIASLSNPWGETMSAEYYQTGYKAVWPRDFFQCAMALLALGDLQTPLVAFEFLHKVQVNAQTPGNKGATGWFLQKTHVDGQIEWVHVQVDQTAMPIMLGWKLWKAGILSDEKAVEWYNSMLKPAADFLVNGGEININENHASVYPPLTQEDRWEEQRGYSPSTTAAEITGLVAASEFATLAGDAEGSKRYLATADRYEKNIEKNMFTTKGVFNKGAGNGNYFIRITPSADPNDGEKLVANNGKEALNETAILDAGFLELVRYGVRSAKAKSILESLPELDDASIEENLKVKYLFTFGNDTTKYPGWRRYGNCGYGEDADLGINYGKFGPGQRGRVWPIFTGERGIYELALGLETNSVNTDNLRNTYIKAMEQFANEGLMLPEQVWDGVGANPFNYKVGEGTNSATPLAWSHAEYIKLVRSVADQKVWDRYSNVEVRFDK